MNTSSLARLTAFALLMFGVAACTPKKEEAPAKPKVTADAAAPMPSAPGAVAAKTILANKDLTPLPKIGAAPDWELQDVNGKTVKSADFKGKIVVVDFWATWCGPCRTEIPGYAELVKKYGENGFTVVGVSVDQGGPEVVKEFIAKNHMNYPVVMADEKVVAAFGGVDAIPTTFLIDRTGQIRDRKVGAEEPESYEKKVVTMLATN